MKQGFTQYGLMIICVIASALLVACKPVAAKYPTAGDEINTALNSSIKTDRMMANRSNASRSNSVKNALLPPLALNLPNNMNQAPPERHFDVAADNMPAKNFFVGLVSGTKDNMLVDPSITGNITLHLKNVTIDEALRAARDMFGYQFKRTDVGYEILSPKLTTQIFTINYLNIKRTGSSQTQLVSTDITSAGSSSSSGGASTPNPSSSGGGASAQGSGTTVTTKADNDFWINLGVTLKTLIGASSSASASGDQPGPQNDRWVVVNPQASIVMVHAYPNELHRVSRYLQTIQNNLQREVIIEAKILEITLDANYQAGINWKILSATQNGSIGLGTNFVPVFTLAINNQQDNFNSVMNMLSQQGNIQVLSSPHISTINNQEAVIKVGNDQYFVTGYTSNITPSGSSNTTSQSVTLTPFYSGITLDVTPQISKGGNVTLYIHPSISLVKEQNKTIDLGTTNGTQGSVLTLPLAFSSIRESDNIVHAQNGQIVVIGGLMQNQTSETITGTPGLMNVPVAGALARNTNQVAAKTELVILLRPIVVNNKTWGNQLQDVQDRFNVVQRGFHMGGLPGTFGTKGEYYHQQN